MEPFDPTRPNIARVWDYWLGGKDNFAADRELAEKLLAVHPPSAQMARENRSWYGDSPAPDLDPPTATFIGGVARKV